VASRTGALQNTYINRWKQIQLGPKKRRDLLRHFGGQQEIERAKVKAQLTKVGWESVQKLEKRIYAWFA